jgi:hypothetical protein
MSGSNGRNFLEFSRKVALVGFCRVRAIFGAFGEYAASGIKPKTG